MSMRGRESGAGRKRRPRADDDRGMSAVEFVLLTPIMFMLLMLTVQFAVYMFARQAAQSAVNAGGRVAREHAATKTGCDTTWPGLAQTAVHDRAASVGKNLLDPNSGVSTSQTSSGKLAVGACAQDIVTVFYTSPVPTIVPGMHLHVTVNSSGPIEQLVNH